MGGQRLQLLVVLCLLVWHSSADVYLHNMRGSNNRLAEQTATRSNNNRLFDSQNNARGGYNVGDRTTASGTTTNSPNPDGMLGVTPEVTLTTATDGQYPLVFLEGSVVNVEWTSQHGCGGNEANDPYMLNCGIIIQYMCDTDNSLVTDRAMQVTLRDGATTTTPTAPSTAGNGATAIATAFTTNQTPLRGRHENEAYYYECGARQRNKGLYLADQTLNGNTARFTRQNNNGAQSGLECPEERDYYPYWGPTPWRDVVVLSDHVSQCNDYIAPNSQNVVAKGKCTDPDGNFDRTRLNAFTQDQCETATTGGKWVTFNHNIAAPECRAADWSRVNHLGGGRTGYPLSYNWTLPTVDILKSTGFKTFNSDKFTRCVMRLRYNISTDDYDPYTTDYLTVPYRDELTGAYMPVTEDPTVDIGAQYIDSANQATTTPTLGLRLAIDTSQFGRTFQDRSHVFYIMRRTVALENLTTDATAATGVAPTIYNLNVKGKRGNIVQTYPAVEYDFVPNVLHVKPNDFIHIQWTGSNTHNNGGDGGDGQTGDAGQGTTGTDRHNFAFMGNIKDNYPLPLDKEPGISMWNNVECFEIDGTPMAQIDCQIRLSTSGYFWSLAHLRGTRDTTLDPILNNAPPSLAQGVLVRFTQGATGKCYNYMCTRNNSFSNRSQKASIVIDSLSS